MTAWLLAIVLTLDPAAPDAPRLADAIAVAATERPVVGGDPRRTAALLLATALAESHLRPDAIGDQGRSCGYFGIWVGRSARRCALLIADVYGAARIARDMLAESMQRCRALPEAERLSGYIGSSCDVARRQSRHRWWMAAQLLRTEGAS